MARYEYEPRKTLNNEYFEKQILVSLMYICSHNLPRNG